MVLILSPLVLVKTEESPYVQDWFNKPFSYLAAQTLLGFNVFKDSITQSWQRYLWLVHTEERNIQLTQEIARLKSELSQMQHYLQENQKLRMALKLTEGSEIQWLLAEPISAVTEILRSQFWINRGSDDGVQVGQAVLSGYTIIGSIFKVFPNQSQVLLLTDRFSVIDVMSSQSSVKGLLEGLGEGRAVFKPFALSKQLQVGEDLVSTGIGQLFPKGIKLAQISKVFTDPETGLYSAEVELNFDPFRLDYLFVALTKSKQDHVFWGDQFE